MTESRLKEFVSLLTEHQMALRCFILSMLPGCPDAADILQDTNVVLWEKMDSYKHGTPFRAWAFTVARYKVLQYRDREKRFGRVTLSEELLDVIEEKRRDVRPDFLESKLAALNHCLAALNVSERAIIWSRYTDRGADANSGILGGSLRVTLCRIRRKLRDCVEKRMHWKGLEA